MSFQVKFCWVFVAFGFFSLCFVKADGDPPALENGCGHNEIQCADGACVSKLNLCNAANGCPIDTPERCSDGTCAVFASHPGFETQLSICSPESVVCDSDWYNIKCDDGRCVADVSQCGQSSAQPAQGCPNATPIECLNGKCVLSASDCDNTTPTATGTLSGDVFEDSNGDGEKGPGEEGIAEIFVVIWEDFNGIIKVTYTDSEGHYSVELPGGGNYMVTVKDQPDLGETPTTKTSVRFKLVDSVEVNFGFCDNCLTGSDPTVNTRFAAFGGIALGAAAIFVCMRWRKRYEPVDIEIV